MGAFIDLTGQRFNKLTVLEIAERGNGKIKWKCQCDCGNTVVVAGNNLKNGHSKSCGCEKHKEAVNAIDMTGRRYGKLTVIKRGSGRFTTGGAYKGTWVCQCDCGNLTEIDGERIRTGRTTSCGCKKKDNRGGCFEDLTGQRFERLTVIGMIPMEDRTAKGYNWLCQCDCGNTIKANTYKLRNGLQKSCGCLKEENKYKIGEVNRKYEYSNKRLYGVYKAMISRCYNATTHEYENYGGRGIRVFDGWLGENGYDAFAEYALSTGYDTTAGFHDCTIDRIDTNGHYEPGNVRWVTNEKQQNNRRNNVRLTYQGEEHTMKEWSDILNISYGALAYHCRRKGRTLEEAVSRYNSARD